MIGASIATIILPKYLSKYQYNVYMWPEQMNMPSIILGDSLEKQ